MDRHFTRDKNEFIRRKLLINTYLIFFRFLHEYFAVFKKADLIENNKIYEIKHFKDWLIRFNLHNLTHAFKRLCKFK